MTTFEVPLLNGGVALIDAEDAHLVSEFKWRHARGYALAERMRNRVRKSWRMHRLILPEAPADMHIDHINGNGLDNRRANLRVVTPALNQVNRHRHHPNNTSGVRGVCWHTPTQRWTARLGFEGRTVYLGLFDDIDAAAEARRQAELHYYGEACPPLERTR